MHEIAKTVQGFATCGCGTEVELSPHHLLVEGLNPATAKCQWLQVNEIAKIVQGFATCGCGTEVEHSPHYLLVEGLNLATPNGIR